MGRKSDILSILLLCGGVFPDILNVCGTFTTTFDDMLYGGGLFVGIPFGGFTVKIWMELTTSRVTRGGDDPLNPF